MANLLVFMKLTHPDLHHIKPAPKAEAFPEAASPLSIK
jgi:hypothetical protein